MLSRMFSWRGNYVSICVTWLTQFFMFQCSCCLMEVISHILWSSLLWMGLVYPITSLKYSWKEVIWGSWWSTQTCLLQSTVSAAHNVSLLLRWAQTMHSTDTIDTQLDNVEILADLESPEGSFCRKKEKTFLYKILTRLSVILNH